MRSPDGGSSLHEVPADYTERSRGLVGDHDGVTDRYRELVIVAQRDRDVKHHAGLERHIDAAEQAEDIPLAPVRREGNAHAVARTLAIAGGISVTIDDGLHGIVHVRAGIPGAELLDRG